MDVQAIRQGIKTTLETIPGLRVYAEATDNPVAPFVYINTETPFIEYHVTMAKGAARLNFLLEIVVDRQSDRRAQEALDAYLSAGAGQTKSIVDALEADRTLDGSCSDCTIASASGLAATTSATAYASLPLTVYAPRNL